MGTILENLQNLTITPPNTTALTDSLTNSGGISYIQDTINSTTEGWAVFALLIILYFFGLYISRNDQAASLSSNNTIDSWIKVSTVHLLLSIILFATGWLPGWQKFLWGVLLYLLGLLFGYLVKPKFD